MKKTIVCLVLLICVSSSAMSQLVFRHHYFQTDLSNYDTYRLASFMINGKKANPAESSQLSAVQSKLHEALSKRGFEQSTEPDILVFLALKVDTLGVAIPNASKRDLMTSFSVDIREDGELDKIFVGEVNGLLVNDGKTEKRLKKIYRKFFYSFEK
ncbi:MAG: DUF4136 domain-containing protein [Reichenbachiella sp.]|uniref:DUF4136 domain-containing protein n=1 Tax=Reichenbachiella sp. TaxID=2184521 RepID=UPI0032631321